MSVGLSIASVVIGVASYQRQKKAAKAAAREQKEQRKIQRAEEQARDRSSRRALIKRERIQRARLVASGAMTGTGESSGMAGALSAIGANFGSSVARASGTQRTMEGLSASSQRQADAIGAGQRAAAFNKMAQGVIGGLSDISGSLTTGTPNYKTGP